MPREPRAESIRIPEPFSPRQVDAVVALISQLGRATSPKFYGIDKLTDPRILLVGNHTIYGVFDVPFKVAELWKRNRLAIRSLGDHRHYAFPVWRDLLDLCGVVRGTRPHMAELRPCARRCAPR